MTKYIPAIAITGPSGSGKSTSLRNLPPDKTAVLNIEEKPLPFRGTNNWIHNKMIQAYGDLGVQFAMASKNPAIEYIVIESFTAYSEKVLAHCRTIYKNYDIFTNHNKMILDFLDLIKRNSTKFVFMTAIDELQTESTPEGGNRSRRIISVSGRELLGKIEHHLVVNLFTEVLIKNGKPEFFFRTQTDGTNTAKSPMGMFGDLLIPNDLMFVTKALKMYYEL